MSAAGADPEPAADRHHQHLGYERNHRLRPALLLQSQRLQYVGLQPLTLHPRRSNVHQVVVPTPVCLHSAESAAADPGDVHHHPGDPSAVPPTVRAVAWGGM